MSKRWIYGFQEALDDVTVTGGKARSLVRMTKAGFVVPPGFVISARIQEHNQKFDRVVLQAFDGLQAEYVAVRSSAVAEDGHTTAWAGQLETRLNVTENQLLDAITVCWKSAQCDRAQAYAQQHDIQSGAVAVVVQKMIQSEVSGVAFSAHPVTRDQTMVVIEAGLGLGEAIVSGTVTPDTYIVQKQPVVIVSKHISMQEKQLVLHNGVTGYVNMEQQGSTQKLSDTDILELTTQVKKLEAYYEHPVDVEWAFAAGKLYIMQCRPITAL